MSNINEYLQPQQILYIMNLAHKCYQFYNPHNTHYSTQHHSNISHLSLNWYTDLQHILQYISDQIDNMNNMNNMNKSASYIDQYKFLRSTWVGDKIDYLNKTVSIFKQKIRNLVQLQNHTRINYWEGSIVNQQNHGKWDYPEIEIMSQKINALAMNLDEQMQKYNKISVQNTQIIKKYEQSITKANIYKQKIKKTQKQLFQVSKKRSEVQKQLFQFKNKSIHQKSSTKKQNKQNQQTQILNQSMNQSLNQAILINDSEQPQTELTYNSSRIYDKYRNLTRRTTTYISPNSSMDSLKSVKFQRTVYKKLVMKDN